MGHYDEQYEDSYLQRRKEIIAHNEPIIQAFEKATSDLYRFYQLTLRDDALENILMHARTTCLWLRYHQPKDLT